MERTFKEVVVDIDVVDWESVLRIVKIFTLCLNAETEFDGDRAELLTTQYQNWFLKRANDVEFDIALRIIVAQGTFMNTVSRYLTTDLYNETRELAR